ncbi:hypothetical protein D3C81_1827260 [compost metagenome]
MFLHLGAKTQLVDGVNDIAQGVATADLVFNLAEDFANLVLDGIRPARPLLEPFQIGEQFFIDKFHQIVTGHGHVVVNLAIGIFGGGPARPAIARQQDRGIGPAF